MLTHYNPSLPVELAVDASPYCLGAVIMHEFPNGERRPIAYASRTLNEHLAIMFGLKWFHLHLYGRHFTIQTDHKPLERIFGPKTAIPSLVLIHYKQRNKPCHESRPSALEGVGICHSWLAKTRGRSAPPTLLQSWIRVVCRASLSVVGTSSSYTYSVPG